MRESAFRGTWTPNARPFISLTPDAYVSLQGETTIVTCGECRRPVDFNRYLTQLSTEASVDSPPGSASFTLSIPDNDVNDFFSEGKFIIIPMMEVEFYAKGYFTVGGIPQYYKIFWGLVSSVSQSWSNGVTTIQISCKDMLRWWELTNVVINPAFLNSFGSSAGHYQLFGNQFASRNPYTVIIQLAKEAMGDFSYTTGSMTSYDPTKGPENPVLGAYSLDMMGYWAAKFSNFWNNLVLYGTSGRAYTFPGDTSTKSSIDLSKSILEPEAEIEAKTGAAALQTGQDKNFKRTIGGIAAFKTELPRAGEVEFFQTEAQSKLSIALTARDQAGFEFYCDTTGDIVFKPPFYNLNVIPNKPVSWIQDHDIMEDQVNDSEAEVYTHVTSSGSFTGGSFFTGIEDDITTRHTGFIDFHLLRRYGWRRLDYPCEWAANPRQLFFHLIDHLDRVNSKRQNGSITVPMRPELRMGFPVWVPKYDSFFYVNGISHNYAVGGQATTTLTLSARRSKFIAPKTIGTITQESRPSDQSAPTQATEKKKKKRETGAQTDNAKSDKTYVIKFPEDKGMTSGFTSGLSEKTDQDANFGEPQIIRDPKTGKLLGFPNVVMVYSRAYNDKALEQYNKTKAIQGNSQQKQGDRYKYANIKKITDMLEGEQRGELMKRIRAHRYETAASIAGSYDYAHDKGGFFQELTLIPVNNVTWENSQFGKSAAEKTETETKQINGLIETELQRLNGSKGASTKGINEEITSLQKKMITTRAKYEKEYKKAPDGAEAKAAFDELASLQSQIDAKLLEAGEIEQKIAEYRYKLGSFKKIDNLNMMVQPVSDEYGFELIGHYRYGRGAFIHRGDVKVSEVKNESVPDVEIQFSPTGGFLTDTVRFNNGKDMSSLGFASAYEEMQPEDFTTGAHFIGAKRGETVGTVTMTQRSTYTTAQTRSQENISTVIYADVDAVKRGRLLAELRPTVDSGLGEAFTGCSCGIGKTDWFTILPQEELNKVLNPNADGVSLQNDFGTSYEGFFSVLNKYLIQRFDASYQSNASRETAYVGNATVGSSDDLFPTINEQDNILGDPQHPLFSAASNGDIDALEALQNQAANWNFGSTKDARENAGREIAKASERAAVSTLSLPGETLATILTSPPIEVTTDSLAKQKADEASREKLRALVSLGQAEAYAKANPNSQVANDLLAEARANYQVAEAAAESAQRVASKDSKISKARSKVNEAASEVTRLEGLLNQSPNDKTLQEKLADARSSLAKAQDSLQVAGAAPDTVELGVQYQPIAPPPTQGGILNPTQFVTAWGAYRSGLPFTKYP